MTKPLMEPGMLAALWARLVGGTPSTGKVPTVQGDGSIDWQTPSGGSGGADRSAVTALSISSGNVTVDCAAGDFFTLALTANVTGWTFTNLPAAGVGMRLMIVITQDTTARTVAWPATFAWNLGVPDSISTAVSSRNALVIETVDEGDTWVAALRNDMTRVDELPSFTPAEAFAGSAYGFWFEFDDYANLASYSDGSGTITGTAQAVGYAEDLSGNANHLIQVATVKRPETATDTYGCLSFDGGDDGLYTVDTTPNLSSSMLMFVALKSADAQSLVGYAIDGGVAYFGCAQNSGGGSIEGSCGGPTYYKNGTIISGTTRDSYHDAFHDNTWCLLEIRNLNLAGWTGSSLKLFGYGSYEFAGKVNAVFLCDTPSDTLRSQLRTYFGARIGLAL